MGVISYWRQLNSLHSRENGEGKGVVVGEGGLVAAVVVLVGVVVLFVMIQVEEN